MADHPLLRARSAWTGLRALWAGLPTRQPLRRETFGRRGGGVWSPLHNFSVKRSGDRFTTLANSDVHTVSPNRLGFGAFAGLDPATAEYSVAVVKDGRLTGGDSQHRIFRQNRRLIGRMNHNLTGQ